MNQALKEKSQGKPLQPGRQDRILVAPLDWGLGHAARCIPIIRELLALEAEVWLAGEGAQEQLLKTEFPGLPFLHLPGYRIRYSKTAAGLLWKMIQQSFKIRRAIQYEHDWLEKKVKEHGFDAVISDNRYGLYHSSVPCIFITHQLNIKSPLGVWTEKIIQKRNYKYINRFTECWVPDTAGENNLAGVLSHPDKKPVVPVKYIGLLSRVEKKEASEIKNHLLIILSGPEPQRTILENKIISAISHYNGTATIVRGLPGETSLIPSTNMIKFYNHLSTSELNKEMQQAVYIISRSGYSTIMDLMTLQKKSILIPTPGQTEQEYLADYLSQKGITYSVSQKNFSMEKALREAKEFVYSIPSFDTATLLKQVISKMISSLVKSS